MHTKAQFHDHDFGRHWSSKNVSITILLTLLFLVLLLLAMTITAVPAEGQSSVPATARQAANVPQYAARLAPEVRPATRYNASRAVHPTEPRASFKSSLDLRVRNRRGVPLGDDVLYDNGPINGTTDAWTINSGFVVSDTFTVPNGGAPVNGLTFGAWVFPGDVLHAVEISITSSEFGGTTYTDQVVNFTQSSCSGNQYGFNVCTETGSNFTGPNLTAGTYWVNLQNAVVDTGDPIYWDENSGIGCGSQGCPSLASENSVGTIPSEAFTVLQSAITCGTEKPEKEPQQDTKVVTAPPSPTQTYNVIYNFTGAGDGGGGTALVVDAAGTLYGTTGGGPFDAGTVFKLKHNALGWLYTRLYAFSGPDGSGPNSPLAVAADGELYGSTAGGGSSGDGTLFGLAPPGHILPNVFASWMQRLRYSFTGGSDGTQPGGSIALDSSNNIYGTAGRGGANGGGTVYEFTNGGLQVLHAFPAFSGDGVNPVGVVSGAGGLYGLTWGGGAYYSGTVYTLAGGYNILYNFNFQSGQGLGGGPIDLAADASGNLYVSATNAYLVNNCFLLWNGTIFELTYPDWSQVTLMNWQNLGAPLNAWMTPDASGNVYGTVIPGEGAGEVFKLTCCWTYTTLHQFSGPDGAGPAAGVVIDAQGNIYGTTTYGGAYGRGVVWEITP